MSRRARAAAFGAAALACAGLAAALAGGYRADLADEYGPLREVVVTLEPLPAGRPLRPAAIERALEVRRVPERFVPPDALARPEEALGLAPPAPIAPSSYLLASQLAEPAARRRRPGVAPGRGRAPVEIAVSGAGAIRRGLGEAPLRVDVVVTTEPGPGRGPGRTFVAAENVRLLDLRPSEPAADPGPGPNAAGWTATLALTRSEALRLIQAESFARQVRLIARSASG